MRSSTESDAGMKVSILALCVLVGFSPFVRAEDAENELKARVVLFIPNDAQPPEMYEQRLASLAVAAESFLARWTGHWKRPVEREQIFARNKDGNVQVTVVRGTLKAKGRDALPEIRSQAVAKASHEMGLKPDRPVIWWILYDYPGVKGFQGGARGTGGIAINAYPQGTDLIRKDVELASPAMAEMAIKGTIHEFGHALGLPHIGPRPGEKLGNSLMGPINRAFWGRTGPNDTRVYLSGAAAAMLWKHPVFRRETTPARRMPQQIKVAALAVAESDKDNAFFVTGRVSATIAAHAAVILDSQRGQFGDYWKRSYVGAINAETGEFKIEVNEPFNRGTLYLSFCFENGAVTVDGRTPLQRGSALEISYSGEEGSRRFNLPE